MCGVGVGLSIRTEWVRECFTRFFCLHYNRSNSRAKFPRATSSLAANSFE